MNLQTAFETTSDDVYNVMTNAGKPVDFDEAEKLFAEHVSPRANEVSKAALAWDEMEDQTDAAHVAIRAILEEAGVLPQQAPTF